MGRSENIIASKLLRYIFALFIVFINFTIFFGTNNSNSKAAISQEEYQTKIPTPTNTATPSILPSLTITTSPSNTPTPTVSPSPNPTPSDTPTITPTSAPKPTETPTPTITSTVSPSPTPTSIPTPTRELIFSEINWSGSSLGGDDEWIELYNNSSGQIQLSSYYIEGALNGNKKITLSGILDSNKYYLIAKQDFNPTQTRLSISPDQIESKLSLTNSGFNLKIYKKERKTDQIVDEVNTGGSKPFAGKVSPEHASMERIDYMLSGSDPVNWKSASTKLNLRQNHYANGKCELDYGTPKGKFEVQKKDNEINFWDICTNSGELNSSGKLEISNFSGTLFEEKYRIDEKVQKVSLIGNATGATFSIGKLTIVGNDGLIIEKKLLNSDIFSQNNGAILFVTSKGSKSNIKIDLNLNLKLDQKILLEKIQIDEVNNFPNQISYLAGSFDTESNIINDTVTDEKVLQTNTDNDEIVFNETIPFFSQKYQAIKIEILSKANQLAPTDELNDLLTLNISNSHNLKTNKKSFKQKDFEKDFDYLSFISTLAQKGVSQLTIHSKKGADLTIKEIKVSYLNPNDYENGSFDFTDFITANNYSYDRLSQGLIIQSGNNQEKVIAYNSENICLSPSYCEIEIPITLIYSTSEQVMKVYFGTKGSDKTFYVNKINKTDFDENKKLILKLNKSTKENQKIIIRILLQPNTNIIIHEASYKYIENINFGNLKSISNTNWNTLKTLSSRSSASGQNGQLLDILATDTNLNPGSYSFSYKINKLENYNSGKDLVIIKGVDASGYKLFESIIDENDLEWKKNTSKSINFKLETSRRIYVYIHYYGNHLGAQSDIEIGEFEMRQG